MICAYEKCNNEFKLKKHHYQIYCCYLHGVYQWKLKNKKRDKEQDKRCHQSKKGKARSKRYYDNHPYKIKEWNDFWNNCPERKLMRKAKKGIMIDL